MAEQKDIVVDPTSEYETDFLNFRIIAYSGAGLFLTIVICFVLMWYLQYKILEPQAEEIDKQNASPLALTEAEKLPEGVRLQSAPGFGVDDPKGGRINLELRESQAEYRELHKQWKKLWEKGETDEKTGTVVSLSIEEAKKKFLESRIVKNVNDDVGNRD